MKLPLHFWLVERVLSLSSSFLSCTDNDKRKSFFKDGNAETAVKKTLSAYCNTVRFRLIARFSCVGKGYENKGPMCILSNKGIVQVCLEVLVSFVKWTKFGMHLERNFQSKIRYLD